MLTRTSTQIALDMLEELTPADVPAGWEWTYQRLLNHDDIYDPVGLTQWMASRGYVPGGKHSSTAKHLYVKIASKFHQVAGKVGRLFT